MSEPEPQDTTITVHGEVFHAQGKLSGARILHYGAAMARGGVGLYAATEDFFAEVFSQDEHARFQTYIQDPKREIPVKDLISAFDEGLAAYMRDDARPTSPPTP